MTGKMMNPGWTRAGMSVGLDARRGRGRARDPDGQVSSREGLHPDRTTSRDLGATRHYTVSATRGWWDRCRVTRAAQVLFVQNMVTTVMGIVHKKFTADSNPLQTQPGGALDQKGTVSANLACSPWENRLAPPGKQPRGQSSFLQRQARYCRDQLTSIDSPQHRSFRSATSLDSLPWLKLSRIAAFTSPAVFIR